MDGFVTTLKLVIQEPANFIQNGVYIKKTEINNNKLTNMSGSMNPHNLFPQFGQVSKKKSQLMNP